MKFARFLSQVGLLVFSVFVAQAQSPISNGQRQAGTMPEGGSDTWTFTATEGERIFVRVGTTNFTPRIRLFAPSNEQLEETTSGNSAFRDGFVSTQAPQSGLYTVLVSPTFGNQSGTYAVHLGLGASPIAAPADGDEDGPIVNGALTDAALTLGDIDVRRFDAVAGAGMMVRVGATGFTPWIQLFSPSGELVAETTSGNSAFRDGNIYLTATNAGSYTLMVSAAYANQSGPYQVTAIKIPGEFQTAEGDEGGTLTNGVSQAGSLALGDLEVWSFPTVPGENVILRAGASGFTPWLRLYNESGSLVAGATSGNSAFRDGFLQIVATNGGLHTLILSATYAGQDGDYTLHLARGGSDFITSPGDQGGTLTNGLVTPGNLILGDLDLWSFEAGAGNNIFIRLGAESFTPWLRLFDPAGVMIAETTSGNSAFRDGNIQVTATNSGRYLLVASAAYAGQSGNYLLSLTKHPGEIVIDSNDDGGQLLNGATNAASLTLGDLDVWSFWGTPGDSNVFRVTTTGFTPWIQVYDPTGRKVAETTSGNSAVRQGSVSLVVTNEGPYSVVISATYAGQSGTYDFKQSRFPPDLNMPELVVLDETGNFEQVISAQDPDEPAKPLVFNLLSAPEGMTLELGGATNATIRWPLSEAHGPSTNIVIATVTDRVNGRDFIRTNRMTVIVREVNTAPQFQIPGSFTVDELAQFTLQVSATDADLPANELSYTLLGAPEGMQISPSGAISWLPTEAQGPSSHTVQVVVTDANPWDELNPSLSTTNSFTITVREVNVAPETTAIPAQTIDELVPFAIQIQASDRDLPANALTFSFAAPAPAGMTLDPATGQIAWTPTEAQGPSTNLIAVRISDNGVPGLSVTNQFSIVVREVNSAPVLPVIERITAPELALLTITNTATDRDLPANTLTYRLITSVTNAAINDAGVVSWTPSEAQGPSTNTFTIVVTDDGIPALSATNAITVVITEVNTTPSIEPLAPVSLHYGHLLSVQATASDADLPANLLEYSVENAPAGLVIDSTGRITWTPEQSQLGNYSLTVKVRDNGSPALEAATVLNVSVTGEGTQLGIEKMSSGILRLVITGDTGYNYDIERSEDLILWQKLVELKLETSPFRYIDPDQEDSKRFYRLKLLE